MSDKRKHLFSMFNKTLTHINIPSEITNRLIAICENIISQIAMAFKAIIQSLNNSES